MQSQIFYQIFADQPDIGWSLDGCWGSENAVFSSLEDAKESADFLAQLYPGVNFGVFEVDADRPIYETR